MAKNIFKMHFYYITGSSAGLGKAIAIQCLENGHKVVGFSRTNSIDHKNFKHFKTDLSNQDFLKDFEFPYIDDAKNASKIILINNAATIQPVKRAGNSTSADIINAYTLNIIAPAVLTNLFINNFAFCAAKKLIISISSGAASSAVEGWSVYCSTKAAMDMYSKVVAMEQEKEKYSCLVASIAPGIVDTAMQAEIRNAEKDEFARLNDFIDYKENNLLASADEAAAKILFAIEKIKKNTNVVFSVKN